MLRKNQKGFTLVELIIAVAILAIVTMAVCGFIMVGSKSYTSANTDIMLQQEAQLALNQMSDVIIDTTDSISYNVGTPSGLTPVLKDSEYSGEATDKNLMVVNRLDSDSQNDNPSYWFYWNKPEEKIYFSQVDGITADTTDEEIKTLFEGAEANKAVLAEHVTDLNIDLTQFEENRVVMISLTLKNGNREYSTSNNVTVRNRVSLNIVNIDPMKRAEEFVINNISSVVLEPGDSYEFDPTVVTSEDSYALAWELIDGSQNGTTYSTNGNKCTVNVGIGEDRHNVFLRVARSGAEDYEGQNARTAVLVNVQVKRVDSVNLTASPSTVKAGESITISGGVSGSSTLGDPCDGKRGYVCKDQDDLSNDYKLTNWTIVEGSGTITSWNDKGAVITVDPNMTGDRITIEATSVLSDIKSYSHRTNDTNSGVNGIQGRVTIAVDGEPAPKGDSPIMSDYKFGTDNDDSSGGKMFHDYMYNDIPLPNPDGAVICVRVRKQNDPTATIATDKIILYDTTGIGSNLRFFPDMFMLDLNETYDFFMQIIIPIDRKNNNLEQGGVLQPPHPNQWEGNSAIAAEYLAGLNPETGKYEDRPGREARYYYSQLYYGTLSKPVLSYTVYDKGVTRYYPSGDEEDYYYSYSIANDSSAQDVEVLGEIKVDDSKLVNILPNSVREYDLPRYTIYKDGSADRVWGLNQSTMQYDEPKTFADGSITVDPTGSIFMKAKKSQVPGSAIGTYQIVPGYIYSNQEGFDYVTGGHKYNFIYRQNITNEFAGEQYIEQPEAVIPFRIDSGRNMELPPENGEDRWTYFPLPDDNSFPFTRRNSKVQTITRSFTKYNLSGQSIWGGYNVSNIKVDCEYRPATSIDPAYYYVWLYTESDRNGASYTRNIIGRYRWTDGMNEWYRLGWNETDRVTIETNISYVKGGHTYEAYFPLPDESDFPFKGNGPWLATVYTLQAYDKDSGYTPKTEIMTVECTNSGTYTITLKQIEKPYEHMQITYTYGRWTYNNGEWKFAGGASEDTEAVWNSEIYFKNNQWESSYNNKFDCPLPGSASIPALSPGTSGKVTLYNMETFGKDDTYGTGNVWWTPTKTFVMEYSLDSSGKYTMNLYDEWGGGPLATATYTVGVNDGWVQQY